MTGATLAPLLTAGLLTAGDPPKVADPVPVWKAELKAEGKPRTSVAWLGFSPDGQLLAVRTVLASRVVADESQLWVWDLKARKERYQVDAGPIPNFQRSGPFCSFASAETLLTADRWSIEERAVGDGAVTGRSADKERGDVAGVWLATDAKSYALVRLRPTDGAFPPLEASLVRGALPLPAAKPGPAPRAAGEPLSLTLPVEERRYFYMAAVSPDGTRLALVTSDYGGRKPELTLYQIEAGDRLGLKALATSKGVHESRVSALAFSPDGKTLATGGDDGLLKFWDAGKPAEKWEARSTLPASQFTVVSVAFRPDGKVLAYATTDNRAGRGAALVDMAKGARLRWLPVRDSVTTLAWSPDGKFLATGGFNGLLQLWDAHATLTGGEN